MTWFAGGMRKIAGGGCYGSTSSGWVDDAAGNAKYVKDNSTCWVSNDNGSTWKPIAFFSKKKLTPWTITHMPHPNSSTSNHDNLVVFGCSDNGGLWVRVWSESKQTYDYVSIPQFENKTIKSVYYHKKSSYLFVSLGLGGVEVDVNGTILKASVLMTKDLVNWTPIYVSYDGLGNVCEANTVIVSDVVTQDEDGSSLEESYVYVSDFINNYVAGEVNRERPSVGKFSDIISSLEANPTAVPDKSWAALIGDDTIKRVSYRSTKLHCLDDSDTIVFAYSNAIGVVNSKTPYNETIIHNSEQGTVVSHPYSVCANQNGRITVGNTFTLTYDTDMYLPPSFYDIRTSDSHEINWDCFNNNTLNAEFGIIDLSIEGTYLVHSPEFNEILDRGIGNQISSITPTAEVKQITTKPARTIHDSDSTFILNSHDYTGYTSSSVGTWINNSEFCSYIALGLQQGSGNISKDINPILCAVDQNGNRGYKNTAWYDKMTLSEWVITGGFVGCNYTANVYYNVFNTRGGAAERMGLALAVNPSTKKLAAFYNWDAEKTFLCEITYNFGARYMIAVEGGYVHLFSASNYAKAKIDGLDTDLHIGVISENQGESCFWTNKGNITLYPERNHIMNVKEVKDRNPNFNFISSLNDEHNFHQYSSCVTALERSVIGNVFTSKLSKTGTPTTYASGCGQLNSKTPIHSKKHDRWFAQTTKSLLYSTDDGNSWINAGDTNDWTNPVGSHVNDYIIISNIGAYGGAANSTLYYRLITRDTIGTDVRSPYGNSGYFDYIPELDNVVVSNGHGCRTTGGLTILPYSEFVAGANTSPINLISDVDITTYLPSNVYNNDGYIYVCFYDTENEKYDVKKLSHEIIKAVRNGLPIVNALTGEEETHTAITLNHWEDVIAGSSIGWMTNEAVILNDVVEGKAFFFHRNGAIYRLGISSGSLSKVTIKDNTDLGHIYSIGCNDDGNTLYACTDNGLFLINVNTTFSTGADSLKRVQNILEKLGIEEQ